MDVDFLQCITKGVSRMIRHTWPSSALSELLCLLNT